MTKAQYETIKRKHEQSSDGKTLLEFLRLVTPTIGCDEAIAVPWCGMWLCIERNGYCHT